MAATSEQRRAAVVRRLKALGPQPLVFRSGVDIDACHYRIHHSPMVAAPDDRPLGQPAGAGPGEATA